VPIRSSGLGANPSGLCWCGCGQQTTLASHSRASIGDIIGTPHRFCKGHKRPIAEVYTIDEVTGCWHWGGLVGTHGYGIIRTPSGWRLAHRVYYERFVGPIPDGLQVDHLCRVRDCVNPEHLEPVTQAENIRRGFEARKNEKAYREKAYREIAKLRMENN